MGKTRELNALAHNHFFQSELVMEKKRKLNAMANNLKEQAGGEWRQSGYRLRTLPSGTGRSRGWETMCHSISQGRTLCSPRLSAPVDASGRYLRSYVCGADRIDDSDCRGTHRGCKSSIVSWCAAAVTKLCGDAAAARGVSPCVKHYVSYGSVYVEHCVGMS